MLNLFSNTSFSQQIPSGAAAPGLPASEAGGSEIAVSGGFAELLNAEASMVDMLEELKMLLSAEDFVQLENMLAEGQTLPVAEIVAALRQQLADVTPDLVVTAEEVAEATESSAEQSEVLLAAEQTAVPIMVGQMTIPVSIAADQVAMMQTTNGKVVQPVVTGQVAIPSDIEGDAAGLSFNLDNSSADSDQQPATGEFRMAEAMVAQSAQVAKKLPIASLFRTTEAGLTAINNTLAVPGMTLQNRSQPVVQNQVNTALPIYTAMGERGWDQAMGARVLWMVGRQVQGAEVRITPPQLGPVDIRISIQNDQAHVSFAAQHGVVRDALEASIPRLREMLSENNLQLVNVDVNQRNASEERASSHLFNQSSSGEQGGERYEVEEGEIAAGTVYAIQSNGLVDDFA